MASEDQEYLKNYYAKKGIIVPYDHEFPICDHPIEKWCSNCDFDYITYEKIPHVRKYKMIYTWTEEEFLKEMKHGKKDR